MVAESCGQLLIQNASYTNLFYPISIYDKSKYNTEAEYLSDIESGYDDIITEDIANLKMSNTLITILAYIRDLNLLHGTPSYIMYFANSEWYIDKKTFLLNEPTELILSNGQEVTTDYGILLNNNEIWYMGKTDNTIYHGEIKNPESKYKKFVIKGNTDLDFSVNLHLENTDLNVFPVYDLASGNQVDESLFISKLRITPKQNISNYEYFYKSQTVSQLLNKITLDGDYLGKRYVIDIPTSISMMKKLVDNYNYEVGYERDGVKKIKAYTLEFLEEDFNTNGIYEKDIYLSSDVEGTEEEKNRKASNQIIKNIENNKKSFFYYSDINEADGKVNKFGYRIRDYRFISDTNFFYPYYANSVHLVLNSKLLIPLFAERGSDGEISLSFSYDITERETEK